jgi:hypothetical protein
MPSHRATLSVSPALSKPERALRSELTAAISPSSATSRQLDADWVLGVHLPSAALGVVSLVVAVLLAFALLARQRGVLSRLFGLTVAAAVGASAYLGFIAWTSRPHVAATAAPVTPTTLIEDAQRNAAASQQRAAAERQELEKVGDAP